MCGLAEASQRLAVSLCATQSGHSDEGGKRSSPRGEGQVSEQLGCSKKGYKACGGAVSTRDPLGSYRCDLECAKEAAARRLGPASCSPSSLSLSIAHQDATSVSRSTRAESDDSTSLLVSTIPSSPRSKRSASRSQTEVRRIRKQRPSGGIPNAVCGAVATEPSSAVTRPCLSLSTSHPSQSAVQQLVCSRRRRTLEL
jgi:hypothetical protein